MGLGESIQRKYGEKRESKLRFGKQNSSKVTEKYYLTSIRLFQYNNCSILVFSSVQLLSCVRLFATP